MAADRLERLRTLLRDRTILVDSDAQPLRDCNGRRMPWIYYHWNVGLEAEGLELAAGCLLDRLASFESVQLAAYGLTSLPLVTACVMAGGRRYSGLAVRKAPEQHGTRRQVEGVGDKAKPVVIIDDCIGSGRSLHRAMKALEEAGYHVEGSLALVDFPWKGGTEWARALGLRVETLFEVWKDLEQPLDAYSPLSRRDPPWGTGQLPDGLSIVEAARQHLVAGLEGRPSPLPPARLDREHDAAAGLFVSVRETSTLRRLTRNGFLRDGGTFLPLDLARAAHAAGRSLREAGGINLEQSVVSVVTIGEALSSRVSDLNFGAYAIIARSDVQPWKIGCALPNTQFFASEIQQLAHARSTNARIGRHEPATITLHAVQRTVEAGGEWPPFGSSADRTCVPLQTGDAVTRACVAVFHALRLGHPVPEADGLPLCPDLRGLGVTLYRAGRVAGCWVAFGSDFGTLVSRATRGAFEDRRLASGEMRSEETALLVSILLQGEWIGKQPLNVVAKRLRLGRDTIIGGFGRRWIPMLAHVACHNDWSALRTVNAVIDKARTPGETPRWRSYDTFSYLSGESVVAVEFGVPVKAPADETECLALTAGYIARQCGASGLPAYLYCPTSDTTKRAGSLARKVLALTALDRASEVLERQDLACAARRGLRCIVDLLTPDVAAEKLGDEVDNGLGGRLILLEWMARADRAELGGPLGQALVTELLALFRSDGSCSAKRPGHVLGTDHDILPGVAILALGRLDHTPPQFDLAATLAWYRRRFRIEKPWGMTWWHMQAWAAWHARTGNLDGAEFVFEIADWVIARQLAKSGAFIVDYAASGPGFHTACVMEGLADAAALAGRLGERDRAEVYLKSFVAAQGYISSSLLITPRDLFCMPDPQQALGGIREGQARSRIRIDYPAHYLHALCKASQVRAEHEPKLEKRRKEFELPAHF